MRALLHLRRAVTQLSTQSLGGIGHGHVVGRHGAVDNGVVCSVLRWNTESVMVAVVMWKCA